MDVVIISPEPGRHAEIGKQLIGLADHPHDVHWVTYPRAGFSVPLTLWARFEAATNPAAEEKPVVKKAAEPVAVEAKRRGRPPKIKPEPSTDNTTSEEE